MSQSQFASWWTNKRLFWLTFFALLFGIVFLFEDPHLKSYNSNGVYQVTTYRSSGGRATQVGEPRIETGQKLNQREIERLVFIRVFAYLTIGIAIVASVIILARLGSGQPVFRDAFKFER